MTVNWWILLMYLWCFALMIRRWKYQEECHWVTLHCCLMVNRFPRNLFICTKRSKNYLNLQYTKHSRNNRSLFPCMWNPCLLITKWLWQAWLIARIIKSFCSKQWFHLSISTLRYLNNLVTIMFPWVPPPITTLKMPLPITVSVRFIMTQSFSVLTGIRIHFRISHSLNATKITSLMYFLV